MGASNVVLYGEAAGGIGSIDVGGWKHQGKQLIRLIDIQPAAEVMMNFRAAGVFGYGLHIGVIE
mgnify:FL=1